jgi:hypothetical protein
MRRPTNDRRDTRFMRHELCVNKRPLGAFETPWRETDSSCVINATILESCNSTIASAATRKQAAWREFYRPLLCPQTDQALTQPSHRPRSSGGNFCRNKNALRALDFRSNFRSSS